MNNKKIFFLSLFCLSSYLSAEVNQNSDELQASFELSQGYRRDKLTYNLKTGPLTRIKYKFKDVDVYTSRLGMTVRKDAYFLKGVAGYGNVYDGKYRIDTRGGSHGAAHMTGDYTADFALSLGRDFSLGDGWSVAPTIGYGVYIQDFHTGRVKWNTFDMYGHRVKLRRAKEKYKATWYSPQLGLNLRKAITNTLAAYADYSFLFPLSYHSKATHRLHYEQDNNAYKSFGNIATVGLDWNFAKNWSLRPEFEFMKFYSKGSKSFERLHFHKAVRTSSEYRLTLNYTF